MAYLVGSTNPILSPDSRSAVSGDSAITYLSPLLAVLVGILHASLAPVLVVGGVKPNVVLVAVVLVTTLFGFLPGITWAFVAGLTANLLVGDPLGSVPLSLLIAAAAVAGGAKAFGGLMWIYPVAAGFAASIIADLTSLVVGRLVTDAAAAAPPLDLILAVGVLNAALVALLLFPARVIAARYVPDEGGAW